MKIDDLVKNLEQNTAEQDKIIKKQAESVIKQHLESYDAVMPDMKLWSEIIFLQNFTKNTDIKFVVENVKPYYEPFVKPTAKLGRHLFWANFEIPEIEIKDGLTHNERGSSEKGYFDLRPYKSERIVTGKQIGRAHV